MRAAARSAEPLPSGAPALRSRVVLSPETEVKAGETTYFNITFSIGEGAQLRGSVCALSADGAALDVLLDSGTLRQGVKASEVQRVLDPRSAHEATEEAWLTHPDTEVRLPRSPPDLPQISPRSHTHLPKMAGAPRRDAGARLRPLLRDRNLVRHSR